MNKNGDRVHQTAHPHIVKVDGVCGGEAIIEDTRIAVWQIVEFIYRVGLSVEDVLLEWSYLTPAQVYDALAYYFDNRDEIEHARERNSYEYWKEHHANPRQTQTASQ